jgi:diguanylate cyclase (GGDEF)-like protein
MNRNGSNMPRLRGIGRLADQRAIDTEQSAADVDQTTSDADQAGSDADQTAAERDEADASSDQLAAERDQASADQQRRGGADKEALQAYEATRIAREATTISRLFTHVARARTSRLRVETAAERDSTAARRDEAARRRDVRAEAVEVTIAASDSPLAEKLEQIRARAAASRASSAADRDRAAQDRAEAARERTRLEFELDSAHLDDLTGAFRRETGQLALRHEIDRALRADGRFVIAFVDIDGMKQVNDRDGHAAGDQVLKTLVWTMRSNLRSFDPVVRYGGDEFVCGIGGVDLDEVERRFEEIGRSVENDVGVGISVGLAGLEPDETLDQLTARADAALLDAKKKRSGA